jgi:hypothetical protein
MGVAVSRVATTRGRGLRVRDRVRFGAARGETGGEGGSGMGR